MTYLLQGSTHNPQHFSIPARLLSASFMSALIWSMPSSILSSCSVQGKNKIKLKSEDNKKSTMQYYIQIYLSKTWHTKT